MPLYKLRRVIDQEEFEGDARDDSHALAVFGQQLGVPLSLEGPAAPEYMMGRVRSDGKYLGSPLDIPVFKAEDAPS